MSELPTPKNFRAPRVAILVPLFNDWKCIKPLIAGLEAAQGLPEDKFLVIVDDGSTELMGDDINESPIPIEVIRLGANMGHQRSIAIGLVNLAKGKPVDAVIVMDSDGEDKPEDCVGLWEAFRANPDAVVVAQRGRRTETVRFNFFYILYRVLFRFLTGKKLDFGNFSVLSGNALNRLVLMPELWNHYPATIMKSRLEIIRVRIDRGPRFAGKSRMNLISLVNHGLSGIAAFADTAYARLLAWSIAAAGVLGILVILGVGYRLTNENPLPGWLALGATSALVALFQIIAALIIVSFLTLSIRSQPTPPPIDVAESYVSGRYAVKGDSCVGRNRNGN